MAYVLGLNHKLYIQTTGTRAAWPSTGAATNLSEVTLARDVTFSGDAATADVSTRGGGGFRQTVATLCDAEVEFDLVYDTDDTLFTQIRDAWSNKTTTAFAILDGDSATAGTQGFWLDAVVTGFEWDQTLEEAGKVSVTIQNTYTSVALELVTVG